MIWPRNKARDDFFKNLFAQNVSFFACVSQELTNTNEKLQNRIIHRFFCIFLLFYVFRFFVFFDCFWSDLDRFRR